MSPQAPPPMNWPSLWFKLFGAAQLILGALAVLLWLMNRNAASHGGHDLHRGLPIGIVLLVLGAGALYRERITVALSSVGFALIAVGVLYADRSLPLMRLTFEAIYAAVLFLPAIFSYHFRHATRWIV